MTCQHNDPGYVKVSFQMVIKKHTLVVAESLEEAKRIVLEEYHGKVVQIDNVEWDQMEDESDGPEDDDD